MNTPFHVCLSHDVDRVSKTFQAITHFLRSLKSGALKSAFYQVQSLTLSDHYWMFERVMAIEDNLGVKSTFFFLNETYAFRPWNLPSWRLALGYYDLFDQRVQNIIRDLDRRGWEIGLHGSYLSFQDVNLLKKEKADLESIVGHPIQGVRQHYLNLDEDTWSRQAEAGFLYDASFGFRDNIGFKEKRYRPFSPLSHARFYVMPLAIMDCCVISKVQPFDEAKKVIDVAEEQGACLVLNWHQERFNENEFPGWSDLYVRVVQECLARNARFTTLGQYVRDVA